MQVGQEKILLLMHCFITEEQLGDIDKIEESTYANNHCCLAVSELQGIDDFEIIVVDRNGVTIQTNMNYTVSFSYNAKDIRI